MADLAHKHLMLPSSLSQQEKLSLQHGVLSAGKHHQTETHTKVLQY